MSARYGTIGKPAAGTSLAITLISMASTVAVAQTYDLVILNGRVTDPETMFDSVANVGIKDGQIQVLTKEKSPARKRHCGMA